MANRLIFDQFSIDLGSFELRSEDQILRVEPLVLDLIIEMAKQPGKLFTRDDLIESVWQGRVVSDTTISTAIKSARKALGDTGSTQRYIRTIRGRGFQFAAEVEAQTPPAAVTAGQSEIFPSLGVAVLAMDDAISGAVVPMLQSRIRVGLNRIPFLNIRADVTPDASSANEAAAPTHMLQISLAQFGSQMVADASIVEMRSGLQRWARSFDLHQDSNIADLAAQIISIAEPIILRELVVFLKEQNSTAPEARVLEALKVISDQGWNPAAINTAINLLEEAIAQAPQMSLPYALVSLLNAIGYRVGMMRQDEKALQHASAYAEKALSLASHDSIILGLTGCALCDIGQIARGMPLIERALDIDPTNGHAYAAQGAARMMRGDFKGAIDPLRKSIAISPADSRLAVWGAILAIAELHCGDIENAQRSAEFATTRDDVNYLPRLASAAIHLQCGQQKAFESALTELLRVHPEISENEVFFFVGPDAKEVIWTKITAQRA